ncbi:hypothetical protein HanRHA438_Chr07g0314031 [Helianthus annuus]|uniref:Uncharacterized protein n=1 Tax=Helianthus annuus TaxID=4232 RepID=A0A9K3NH80_HELAN|nr:hypothetical protein HanXRQr2_Chr07g0304161 [Helianthus annuus]KAJ0905485.1 hypothetical protein HanPSC8_Chr07g0294541 [Helianthus annuus]KAJ0908759.1 hypothetical protein HanRHA438_Chr07g0314031 [Helianthus annuus]
MAIHNRLNTKLPTLPSHFKIRTTISLPLSLSLSRRDLDLKTTIRRRLWLSGWSTLWRLSQHHARSSCYSILPYSPCSISPTHDDHIRIQASGSLLMFTYEFCNCLYRVRLLVMILIVSFRHSNTYNYCLFVCFFI